MVKLTHNTLTHKLVCDQEVQMELRNSIKDSIALQVLSNSTATLFFAFLKNNFNVNLVAF